MGDKLDVDIHSKITIRTKLNRKKNLVYCRFAGRYYE